MWQRKCYWTLIQVCLTDDVIPSPPPNRGDPSPAAAVDQSRVLQTIERVFAELQLQRQSLSESCHYWITTGNTTSTAAQIPRAWLRPRNLIQIVEEGQMFWWLSKLSCAVCKCLPGSWLIFIIELLISFFNRRGFSHQWFHSDALISFDSQSDLCLGSSLPIWILMLSHHLDYH